MVTASRPARIGKQSKPTTAAYWAVTAIVVGECEIGGAMDLFRLPPFYPALVQLGYPGYLAPMLGTAKVIAGAVLLVPRLPRLKEWAYAGIMINMVGAGVSTAAAREPLTGVIAPAAFAALTLASWVLRPAGRRLG